MTQTTITTAATATDPALADAIDTLSTLALARRHLPTLAEITLSFDTDTDAWQLRARIEHTPTEADDIDAIRIWADALDGGVTRLGERSGTYLKSWRLLGASGTLGGRTRVVVWTQIDIRTDSRS